MIKVVQICGLSDDCLSCMQVMFLYIYILCHSPIRCVCFLLYGGHSFVGGAHPELFCCSFPCQYWNAYSCSFSLESHWYFTGGCYIGDYRENRRGFLSCQGIWVHQQDFCSCEYLSGSHFDVFSDIFHKQNLGCMSA